MMDLAEGPSRKRKVSDGSPGLFRCTWPDCGVVCRPEEAIVKHVRQTHFSDSACPDGEEDFYYEEVSEETVTPLILSPPPTLSHMDMARPPHEDPEYQARLAMVASRPLSRPLAIPRRASSGHAHPGSSAGASAGATPPAGLISGLASGPTSGPTCGPTGSTSVLPSGQPGLAQRSLSWQPHMSFVSHTVTVMTSGDQAARQGPATSCSPTMTFLGGPNGPSAPKMAAFKKSRAESRKCRKVYGMENKEMWCTQCRWKKACTRFIE